MIAFNDHTIKPISVNDYQGIHALMLANSTRFKRFFPKTLEDNLTLKGATAFACLKAAQFEANEEFLFVLHDRQRAIGLIYIKELDWDKREGEFAYCIDTRSTSRGLISKAVKKLSEHAFNNLGLKTLKIITHKDNLASVKVALNAGFNWVATLPKAFAPPDEDALDMELYELRLEP